MKWFRFHRAALDSAKVQKLPDDLFKAWVNLLCVTSPRDGRIVTCDIPFKLRITEERARYVMDALEKAELMDNFGDYYIPRDWAEKQYKSDSSAERMRKLRERKKAEAAKAKCDVTGDGTVTPPDTETEGINKELIPMGTKKKKKVENGKRLSKWLADEGHSALPRSWVEYAANLGWDRGRVETVARAFRRYWDSPDAKRPVKRDWNSAWSNWVDREHQNSPAGAGRRAGYSLDAVHAQAVGDVYRTEGREDRLKRLGLGPDTSND